MRVLGALVVGQGSPTLPPAGDDRSGRLWALAAEQALCCLSTAPLRAIDWMPGRASWPRAEGTPGPTPEGSQAVALTALVPCSFWCAALLEVLGMCPVPRTPTL